MQEHRNEPRTLTIEQAARQLGISRTLAYELAAADKLPVPTIRVGRRMVVSRAALDRVLAAEPPAQTCDAAA